MLYAARFDAYIFGCVPPPLIPPKPNPPSLNEERHSEHMFRMPLFPIYLFIFHYTPKKSPSPREAAAPIPTHRKGRGGSVSRRDHNQAAGSRAPLTGGTTYAEETPPNASRSSGEGVWGRGASLREAASPPASPHPVSSGGSAREGASLQRSPLPRIYHIFNPTVSLTGSEKAWACSPVCSRTAAHTALKMSFLMSAGTSIKISSFSGCTVMPKIFF